MNKAWFNYYKWRLLNPIIPCALCNVPGSLLICNHCHGELEMSLAPKCKYCAKPSQEICSTCKTKPPFFEYAYCLYTYKTPLNKMLHQLKYEKNKTNLWALGYLLYKNILNVKPDTDIIIPMPQSIERMRERGFNQVELLLNYYLTKAHKIPVRNNIVRKIVDTPHQTSLTKLERENLPKVFEIMKNVRGLNILIVDDVITTGSTANNLAKTLKLAGANRIELCTLMRA